MKICINNACKAELEDYVERCPNCGRIQKQFNFEKPVDGQNLQKETFHERNGFITFWLWFIIVGNTLMAIISFFPKTMWGRNFPDEYVIPSIISGGLCLVNIIGAFLLLMWKKSGFTIIALSSIMGGALTIATRSFPSGLVGLFLLWFILKIKNRGVSYWDAMK